MWLVADLIGFAGVFVADLIGFAGVFVGSMVDWIWRCVWRTGFGTSFDRFREKRLKGSAMCSFTVHVDHLQDEP